MGIEIDTSEVRALSTRLKSADGRVGGKVAALVRATGTRIQTEAKTLAPIGHDGVDDGHLRDSIQASFEGDGRFGSMTARIEATADYAAYVEYGTSDTAPQPFMGPAFDANVSRYADALSKIAEAETL